MGKCLSVSGVPRLGAAALDTLISQNCGALALGTPGVSPAKLLAPSIRHFLNKRKLPCRDPKAAARGSNISVVGCTDGA